MAELTPQEARRLQKLRSKKARVQPFEIAQRQVPAIAAGAPETIGRPFRPAQALPVLGAVAAPFAAPAGAGIATLGALAAAGGAVGELARQRIEREPFQPVRIAGEAGLGVAGELTAGGARALFRPVARKVGTILRKISAPALDFFTGTPAGAARVALEAPEITRPGFASAQRVETFAKKVIRGLNDVKDDIEKLYDTVIVKEEARIKGRALIPVEPIKTSMQTLRERLRLGTQELRRVSPQTERALTDFFDRVDRTIGNRKNLKLSDAVEIRRSADQLIKFGEGGLGEGLDPRAAFPIRQAVDNLIQQFHAPFKSADNAFIQGLRTVEDSRVLLGIDDTINPLIIPVRTLQKVERSLEQIFKRPKVFTTRLNALDEKLTTVDGFLKDAEQFGSATAFEKNSSGLARIGLIGAVVSGTSDIATGEGRPSGLTQTLGVLALTSPRIVGRGIRGLARAAGIGRRALPSIAAQIGVRIPEGVESAPRVPPLPEQLQDPRRPESLTTQLGGRPVVLPRVPGTEDFFSPEAGLLISPRRERQRTLSEALLARPIRRGRSRVIGRGTPIAFPGR